MLEAGFGIEGAGGGAESRIIGKQAKILELLPPERAAFISP